MTRKLKIIPFGGLSNRIRVLSSVIRLTQQSNDPVTIYWAKNNECGSHFSDLFENINEFKFTDSLQSRLFNFLARKVFFLKRHGFKNVFYKFFSVQYPHHEKLLNLKGYLASCYTFDSIPDLDKKIKPKKEFVDLVLKEKADFESKNQLGNVSWVGIHIRVFEHLPSKELDIVNIFLNQIEKINQPGTAFYVCSNNYRIEMQIKNNFKKSPVYSRSKSYERKSNQGVQDALIDLVWLSQCGTVIGSKYSSFSELGAQMGDKTQLIQLNTNWLVRQT